MFIFKVDLKKAYDSVRWYFIYYMLSHFGFNDKWRGWIRSCLLYSNLVVFVNGYPTQEISIQRGLKQGDPLLPFLFLLVVEGLSGLLSRAMNQYLYTGF